MVFDFNKCYRCETLRGKQFYECVQCFSKIITPLEDGLCPYCLDPRPPENQIWNQCGRCFSNMKKNTHFLDGSISCGYDNDAFELVLHAYKGTSKVPQRKWMIYPLSVLAYYFLTTHYHCIAERFGAHFDCIIPIPGSASNLLPLKEYAGIPISKILIDNRVGGRFADGASRIFDVSRFTLSEPSPRRVLLFDDMLTTGTTAHSAAYSLKMEGAETVVLFTLGKHLRKNRELLTRGREFDINHCFICE